MDSMVERVATLQERVIAALAKARENYPELEGILITLRFKHAGMLVHGRIKQIATKERRYEITISTDYKDLFDSASQDALVGWFAHELSKIAHYKKQSIVGLSAFKLRYILDSKFKRKVERGFDKSVIAHGLGKALLAGRNAVLESESVAEVYKRKLHVYALSPTEISTQTKTTKHKGQALHV